MYNKLVYNNCIIVQFSLVSTYNKSSETLMNKF